MSAKADGGPAFPRPYSVEVDGGAEWAPQKGMSLRDWFAGQALAGICGDGIPGSHHMPGETVRQAYELADLMLKERQR